MLINSRELDMIGILGLMVILNLRIIEGGITSIETSV
jgi:hypothetical protein